jgi:hypothetical protein
VRAGGRLEISGGHGVRPDRLVVLLIPTKAKEIAFKVEVPLTGTSPSSTTTKGDRP